MLYGLVFRIPRLGAVFRLWWFALAPTASRAEIFSHIYWKSDLSMGGPKYQDYTRSLPKSPAALDSKLTLLWDRIGTTDEKIQGYTGNRTILVLQKHVQNWSMKVCYIFPSREWPQLRADLRSLQWYQGFDEHSSISKRNHEINMNSLGLMFRLFAKQQRGWMSNKNSLTICMYLHVLA